MKTRPAFILALALGALLVASAPATAADFHEYRKCTAKNVCPYFVVANAKATRVVRLWISPKCSDVRSSFSGNYNQPVKVKKKKFSLTYKYTTFGGGGATGEMTVSGKVDKKKNVKLTWQIKGAVSPGCDNLLGKQKVTLKYSKTSKNW